LKTGYEKIDAIVFFWKKAGSRSSIRIHCLFIMEKAFFRLTIGQVLAIGIGVNLIAIEITPSRPYGI
jgi:hypothetical protein